MKEPREDTTTQDRPVPSDHAREAADEVMLVVQWIAGAAAMAGAVLPVERHATIFGRGDGDGVEPRATLVRQLPGGEAPLGAVRAPWLSRRQLRLQRVGRDRIQVENLGRSPLLVRGEPATQGVLKAGDSVLIGERDGGPFALFTARERARRLPAASHTLVPAALGEPDPVGIVGESPAIWALREALAFVAPRAAHVLILGPSGAGKERAAQALHALSPRAGRPLVARNAATIPAGLVDVELFGHVANYPNPGMRERPGLVGQAHGSTLFLDEIGELPHELQAHLLRLLDAGEYQRLGDARPRQVDLRVIAATSRPAGALKPDLRARFRHVIEVPGLSARPDDVPILARHLLRRAAAEDPALGDRLFEDGEPRLSLALVEELGRHPLPMQIRELEAILWDAITFGPSGSTLVPGPSLSLAAPPPAEELDAAALQAALDRHDGNIERTARALGMKNRYVLRRLIAKHDLRTGDDRA